MATVGGTLAEPIAAVVAEATGPLLSTDVAARATRLILTDG